jgi:type IV secretion system protein VirB5
MISRYLFSVSLITMLSIWSIRPALAQFAVIDVASLGQLIQQYETLQQELNTAQSSLTQAQQQYAALTGTRGMQQLLSGTQRNYMPTSWADVQGVLQGNSTTYGGLSTSTQGLVTSNAVLTPQQVSTLSTTEQMHLTNERQTAALLQAVTRQALSTTSNRFTSLQQLVAAMSSATDPKGVLDLHTRIGAEQAMLANDTAKLQALYQLAQAQRWAQQQQRREQAIADIGSMRALPPMGLR